jgi:hypothetical protein
VTCDTLSHPATESTSSVWGENQNGLNLSRTAHTNVGTCTDTWTFH